MAAPTLFDANLNPGLLAPTTAAVPGVGASMAAGSLLGPIGLTVGGLGGVLGGISSITSGKAQRELSERQLQQQEEQGRLNREQQNRLQAGQNAQQPIDIPRGQLTMLQVPQSSVAAPQIMSQAQLLQFLQRLGG